MEKAAPRRRAASAFLPAMAASSTNSTRRAASRCTRPMKPVPIIAILVGLIVSIRKMLYPPGSAGLLADHDAVEESRCLGQALFRREQAVLVFDGEHGIVTEHSQGGDEFGPPLGAVTVTAGAEDPAAVALVSVRFGIEHAGARKIHRVKLRVFRVDVEDGVREHTDGGDGIDALPEKMAWIEVATYAGSCDVAEFEHRLRTIDHEPGMHFDGDLHAVISSELCVVDPIRCDYFAPLPVEDLEVIGRPGAGDPVGSSGRGRIAGASGEVDYHGDAELFGEQDGFAADLPVMLRTGFIRMQRVAVTTQSADAGAVIGQNLLKVS